MKLRISNIVRIYNNILELALIGKSSEENDTEGNL